MLLLPFLLFLQVTEPFAVYGILTPNITQLSSTPRHSNVQKNSQSTNWQKLLKDATFQSLIKHTGFTPSLDQKIETDRLLWEKIQAAKFLRKPSKAEEMDRVKMGVLIDMTRENGQLEFRQSDHSFYNCPEEKCKPILNKLLAIWRMQKSDTNNIWIKVKVPRSINDDVYEYSPKFGLKPLNMADSYLSTKMKSLNKHNVWKGTDDNKLLHTERIRMVNDGRISRNDRQFYEMHDMFIPPIKKQSNYQNPKRISFSTIQAPIAHNLPLIIGLTVPPNPITKKYNWNNGGTYYQVDPVNILSEFQKTEQMYDGFLPSTGPTGSPQFMPSLTQPVPFQEVYPGYLWPQYKTQPTTPTNFKPSLQLINYSPLDPFFHEDEGDKFITITTTRPVQKEEEKTTLLYPSSINEQLQSSENSTESDEDKTDLQGTNTQPTASSINIIQVTEKDNGKVIFTTNDLSEIRSVTNRPKPVSKTTRNNALNKLSSAEALDYAPLYIKWGEKIKNSNNKNKTQTKTKFSQILRNSSFANYGQNKSTSTTKAPEIKDNTTTTTAAPQVKNNENSSDTNVTTVASQLEANEKSNKNETSSQIEKNETTNDTITTAKLLAQNVMIENINNKSPEEVVNTLTNIGVQNMTRIEGYPEISKALLDNSSKLISKLTEGNDQISDNSDPISVVINRISQSYSYKTSNGQVRSLKKI
ncbi:uncharacterized protein LOC106667716 [Cimex lectularius]|uniref:Uncharacterized protein n=1 Tax=Cimex lectularius TaxID=79782 RepID=A0A8I6RTP6_CIMLE|nr:uncharacterized protein LOC106667716 [Cimex lectularius]